MKKICFVVSTPYTAKAFLENHFRILSQEYDLYMVANYKDKEFSNYQNEYLKETKNIEIFRKINIIKDVIALAELYLYLRKNKFECVISFTPKAGLIGILSAWLAVIPIRIHFFTGQVWHTKKGFFKFFLKSLDKLVVFFSTDILVDGFPQQNFLIKNKIVSLNKSKVIGKGTISGIDLAKFSPDIAVQKQIRLDLGFEENHLVFMFLGRMNHDKGVIDLAKAFKKLNSKYEHTRLIYVGIDEENIEQQIIQLELTNYIFYGFTNVPEKILQCCDVFCLPSYREAFGLSVIEASACEKPVICSDTYGLHDTMIDSVTGIRCKTADEESIYKSMEYFVLHPEQRMEMGKEGRKYAVDYFGCEGITKKWSDYFKDVFNNRLK